jgi:hypothetical protein
MTEDNETQLPVYKGEGSTVFRGGVLKKSNVRLALFGKTASSHGNGE